MIFVLNPEFTDNLLTAQCFVFFAAGFETSSGTLTFALYELARHKTIQAELFDEICHVMKENGGELTYDCLQKMSYLDKVISGTFVEIFSRVLQLLLKIIPYFGKFFS